MARFLTIDPPVMYPSTKSPRMSKEKYSGGPKPRAYLARVGARNIKPITLPVPAI